MIKLQHITDEELPYSLYMVNVLELSNRLKKLYKDKYNIDDFSKFDGKTEPKDVLFKNVYSTNIFAVLADNFDLNSDNLTLIDGYKRLLRYNDIPNVNVLVKVYDSNISVKDKLKLFIQYNYWKSEDGSLLRFYVFDRGFRFFLYLETNIDIKDIEEEIECYLCHKELIVDNEHLYSDIKTLSEHHFFNKTLEFKKESFNVRKNPLKIGEFLGRYRMLQKGYEIKSYLEKTKKHFDFNELKNINIDFDINKIFDSISTKEVIEIYYKYQNAINSNSFENAEKNIFEYFLSHYISKNYLGTFTKTKKELSLDVSKEMRKYKVIHSYEYKENETYFYIDKRHLRTDDTHILPKITECKYVGKKVLTTDTTGYTGVKTTVDIEYHVFENNNGEIVYKRKVAEILSWQRKIYGKSVYIAKKIK